MSLCALANCLWSGVNTGRWRRFRRALGDPGPVQRRLLRGYLRANADTVVGRHHGFGEIDSVGEWQSRVPPADYDDLAPLVERVRRGEEGVLTRERVLRLVPSSGSVAARKLVPLTARFARELRAAIGPWLLDLFRRHPVALAGKAYWSISPADADDSEGAAAVPVGFAEDTEYLGGLGRALVERTLAVPPAVRRLGEMESFRYATLAHLLRARDLALISIWHPSFLTLLLEPLESWWAPLLKDIESGTLSLPSAGRPSHRAFRPDPRRAAELRSLGPGGVGAFWPRLEVISCWGDGQAANAARELSRRFPRVALEPKGLMATEGFVTLPFAGCRPVAVTSHFFEFLDDEGRPHLVDELVAGGEYSVVVTTGGGFYRYRLRDRVKVEGFLEATPCLRFLGREDRVSDLRGEKLAEGHVARALERTLSPLVPEVAFAMLAPDGPESAPGYTLYLELRGSPPPDLVARLERVLLDNPHYRWCRATGQLRSLELFRVGGSANAIYIEHCRRAGQRLGDIKPAALSAESGWSRRFPGRYAGGAPRGQSKETAA